VLFCFHSSEKMMFPRLDPGYSPVIVIF